MVSIESQIEGLSPEELQQIAEAGAGRFEFEEGKTFTLDETEEMFRYLYAVVLLQDHEEGSRMLDGMKDVIDAQLASGEDADRATDFLVEWAIVAIKHAPESREEFACLPLYEDVIEQLGAAGPVHLHKQVRMRLQLAYHYELWISRAGNPEALTEEELAMLESAEETFLSEWERALTEATARQDAEARLNLHRLMARYYQTRNKPNEAIEQLKLILPLLESKRDYHPADKADLYMDIGRMFLQYKKYQTAKKYFALALEIYQAQGEEWEMIAMKAEAYLEECNAQLS